jgi:hypothetical protein
MNRLLASTLEILNIVLAVGIVLFSVSAFSGVGVAIGLKPSISLLLSFGIGIVIAGVVCGLIAMIALIEGHLRTIANGVGFGGLPSNQRREPTVRMDGLDDRR